jgi:hypothetical protein
MLPARQNLKSGCSEQTDKRSTARIFSEVVFCIDAAFGRRMATLVAVPGIPAKVIIRLWWAFPSHIK